MVSPILSEDSLEVSPRLIGLESGLALRGKVRLRFIVSGPLGYRSYDQNNSGQEAVRIR